MANPYTLMFGREPYQTIPRILQQDQILASFLSDQPSSQIFMLTGVRGSGKTVLLSMIAHKLREKKEWVVVELNAETDLLKSLVSKLASHNELGKLFSAAKINLSFLGLGAEISGSIPITDHETALVRMLEKMKKQGKKLLVTIDEVTNNEYIRVFSSAFQILVRQDLPIYLLMTGLYENIHALQNERSLTFLYRAPKIKMDPLNLGTIALNYQNELKINQIDAVQMARITKGYPYAFQLLGYLCWERNSSYEEVLPEFDQYLCEYVYDKVWAELSEQDKRVMTAIALSENGKIKDIRAELGMETGQFNPYRSRLIRKGLIDGENYGYVRPILPRFKEYILFNSMESF